jgi:hypothetical protein
VLSRPGVATLEADSIMWVVGIRSPLQCAGLNRLEAEDEGALRERSSDPLGLESCGATVRDFCPLFSSSTSILPPVEVLMPSTYLKRFRAIHFYHTETNRDSGCVIKTSRSRNPENRVIFWNLRNLRIHSARKLFAEEHGSLIRLLHRRIFGRTRPFCTSCGTDRGR